MLTVWDGHNLRHNGCLSKKKSYFPFFMNAAFRDVFLPFLQRALLDWKELRDPLVFWELLWVQSLSSLWLLPHFLLSLCVESHRKRAGPYLHWKASSATSSSDSTLIAVFSFHVHSANREPRVRGVLPDQQVQSACLDYQELSAQLEQWERRESL